MRTEGAKRNSDASWPEDHSTVPCAPAADDVPVQLDGEVWGRLPMSFRVEPRALEVVRWLPEAEAQAYKSTES